MPLIYTRHDPRFHDSRLYKGGDGGAQQMRDDEAARQQKVQSAVDAINAKFGQGRGAVSAAPDRTQFMRVAPVSFQATAGSGMGESNDGTGGMVPVQGPAIFDEAGFNAAQKAFQDSQVDVSGAKAARDSMYGDIAGAVRDTAMRDLDHQYTTASNRNLFGLARSGLLGGSTDAESGAQLQELYGEGKLKAEQQGQQASADLRMQDEKTRQNLISLAQSGLDTGTAASLAEGQMASAADSAKGAAGGATVGRLFDDMSQAYVMNQMMKSRYPQGLPTAQAPAGYGNSLFGTNRYTGTIGR